MSTLSTTTGREPQITKCILQPASANERKQGRKRSLIKDLKRHDIRWCPPSWRERTGCKARVLQEAHRLSSLIISNKLAKIWMLSWIERP